MKEGIGRTSYHLDLPPTWSIHNVFHRSLLEPYVETLEHGKNFAEPPPDLVKGEPEYKVETLLGSRCRGRGQRLEYLVRWKGYVAVHDSWEPTKNLHVPDLVKEFHEQEPMAIRRVSIGQGGAARNAPPFPSTRKPIMPFHDFCEIHNDMHQSLETPELRLPSSLPSPHAAIKHPGSPCIEKGKRTTKQDIGNNKKNDCTHHDTTICRPASEGTSTAPLSTPPSVAAEMSDPATELDLDLPDYINYSHPGPPWIRYSEAPASTAYVIEINGKLVHLPYICYCQINKKVFQYGTEGAECKVYGHEIFLGTHNLVPNQGVGDDDLGYFLQDPVFNFVATQALDTIDDPALVAEVVRYCALAIQVPVAMERSELVRELVTKVADFERKFQDLNVKLSDALHQSGEQLKEGCA